MSSSFRSVLTWLLIICSGQYTATLVATEQAPDVPRLALVSTNNYNGIVLQLDSAHNDANQVSSVLREIDFEVSDVELKDMKKLLHKFEEKATEINNFSRDIIFVFFSGHGIGLKGQNSSTVVCPNISTCADPDPNSAVCSTIDWINDSTSEACRKNSPVSTNPATATEHSSSNGMKNTCELWNDFERFEKNNNAWTRRHTINYCRWRIWVHYGFADTMQGVTDFIEYCMAEGACECLPDDRNCKHFKPGHRATILARPNWQKHAIKIVYIILTNLPAVIFGLLIKRYLDIDIDIVDFAPIA